MQRLQNIFNKLWKIYTEQNPSVQKIHDLFTAENESVTNDHIAFRTFNLPEISIDVLSKPFISKGYKEAGQYFFPEKKLFAKHFEHQDKNLPRVFISELILGEFDANFQNLIQEFVDHANPIILKSDDLIFSGRIWGKPSFKIYEKLQEESEYAAWLYVFGFCANHFTVSVNNLNKLNSIEKVNEFLKQKGFRLNDSGGEIKGTPQELLEQSSIRSESVEIEFVEGIKAIPGCYYEFARRYPDSDGKLFSGFIAKSADKIFESTDNLRK